MTDELIQQKASEFEFTDGIYGFKEGVKWALIQLKNYNDDISVDLHSYTICNKGKIVTAPRKVFQILHYFLMNKGKAITRQEILNNIWGTDVIVTDRTVDVHVRKIKIALENDDCIEGIKGVGFKWVG
jgi:two-component system alkaline phosphatase synthesis response regulator PhoP